MCGACRSLLCSTCCVHAIHQQAAALSTWKPFGEASNQTKSEENHSFFFSLRGTFRRHVLLAWCSWDFLGSFRFIVLRTFHNIQHCHHDRNSSVGHWNSHNLKFGSGSMGIVGTFAEKFMTRVPDCVSCWMALDALSIGTRAVNKSPEKTLDC